MKKLILISCLLVIAITINAQQTNFPKLTEPYFGQKLTGNTPEKFVPDILSAAKYPHGHLSFSKDEKTIYWSTMINLRATIVYSIFDGKSLTKPERAEFATETGNGGPSFSPDGKRIYFNSVFPGNPKGNKRTAICYTEWDKKSWCKPIIIESTSDTLMTKGQVSVSKNGNIYFSGRYYSERTPTIYICRNEGGKILPPEKLKGEIMEGGVILDPWIDPNEQFLLCSFPGESNPPMLIDIGISFRQKDGTWRKPVRFGKDVNTAAFERFPSLSPDGKFLFFIRSTSPGFVGEEAYFYWVSVKIIDELKPKE